MQNQVGAIASRWLFMTMMALLFLPCAMHGEEICGESANDYGLRLTLTEPAPKVRFVCTPKIAEPDNRLEFSIIVKSEDRRYSYYLNIKNRSLTPDTEYAFDLFVKRPNTTDHKTDHWVVTERASDVSQDTMATLNVSLILTSKQDPIAATQVGKIPIYSGNSKFEGLSFDSSEDASKLSQGSAKKLKFKNGLKEFALQIANPALVTRCFECWTWPNPKDDIKARKLADCGGDSCWSLPIPSDAVVNVPSDKAYEIPLQLQPSLIYLLTSSFRSGPNTALSLYGTATPEGGPSHKLNIDVTLEQRPAPWLMIFPVVLGSLLGLALSKVAPQESAQKASTTQTSAEPASTKEQLDTSKQDGATNAVAEHKDSNGDKVRTPKGDAAQIGSGKKLVKETLWLVGIALLIETVCYFAFTSSDTKVTLLGLKLDPSQIPQAFFLAVLVGGGSTVSSAILKGYKAIGGKSEG